MNNKIVLIGEGNSGKSTYVKRLITGRFEKVYSPILGVEVFQIGNNVIWDTAGQDRYGVLRDAYFIQTGTAILFIDCSLRVEESTFDKWINNFKNICPDSEIVIFLSKFDINK